MKNIRPEFPAENILLTGPKHSGKTSAGKALAKLLTCEFIDLDELVQQKTGKSPRQLFSESPETFKKAEAAALAEILGGREEGGTCRVIATGGGIIDNQAAAATLSNADAVKVYLDVSAVAAWQRIVKGQRTVTELPPFLRTENPKETHRVLHERRAAAYLRFADIVVKADGKSPDEIAAEIFKSGLVCKG